MFEEISAEFFTQIRCTAITTCTTPNHADGLGEVSKVLICRAMHDGHLSKWRMRQMQSSVHNYRDDDIAFYIYMYSIYKFSARVHTVVVYIQPLQQAAAGEKLFNDFRPNTTRRILIIQRLDNSLSPVEDLLINGETTTVEK